MWYYNIMKKRILAVEMKKIIKKSFIHECQDSHVNNKKYHESQVNQCPIQ